MRLAGLPKFLRSSSRDRTETHRFDGAAQQFLEQKVASRTHRSFDASVVLEPPLSNTLLIFLSRAIQSEPLTSGRLLLRVSGVAAREIWQKVRTFHERRISLKVPGRRGRSAWSSLTRLGRGGSQFERRQVHAEIELRSSRCGVFRYP